MSITDFGAVGDGTTQMIHDISISDCTLFCTEKKAEIDWTIFSPGSINLQNVKLL